ncbi:MAG: hypothetical protein ABTA24_10335 [Arthrobacter sp.]
MSQDNHNEPESGGAPRPGSGPEPSPPQAPWGQAPQWGQQPPDQSPPPYGQPAPQGWSNPYASGPYASGAQGAYPQGPYPPGAYSAPPKPGVIPLRPLGLGEILDGAFQACRRNPAATFGIAVLIQAVISVLTVIFGQSLLAPISEIGFESELTDEQALSLGTTALTGGTALTVVSAIGILLMQGLLVIPVARAILNLKTGFGQTWRLAKGSGLRLAGLGLLLFAAAAVGLVVFGFLVILVIEFLGPLGVFLTVVGVLAVIAVFAWLSVKLSLAPAALVAEPQGVFAAISRSWVLTRRNWWRTFGILLLTSVIVSIIVSVISTPITMLITLFASFGTADAAADDLSAVLPVLILTTAVSAFFGAIGYAFQAAVTSLLYIDLRMRREGFDVALMKDQEIAAAAGPEFVPGRNLPPAASGSWPQGPYNGSA